MRRLKWIPLRKSFFSRGICAIKANLIVFLHLSKNQGFMFLKVLKGKHHFWRYFVTLNTVIIASQIIGAILLGVAPMKSGGFDIATMSMSELLQMLAMFRATDIDPMMDLISLVLAGAVFLGVWFGLGGKCLRAPLTPKGESTLFHVFLG